MILPLALTDESKSLHITSVEKKVQDWWTNFYHNIHQKAQLENSQPYWYISQTQLEKKKNSFLFRSSNLSKSILGSRSVEATAPERVWSLGHVLLAELQHKASIGPPWTCVFIPKTEMQIGWHQFMIKSDIIILMSLPIPLQYLSQVYILISNLTELIS